MGLRLWGMCDIIVQWGGHTVSPEIPFPRQSPILNKTSVQQLPICTRPVDNRIPSRASITFPLKPMWPTSDRSHPPFSLWIWQITCYHQHHHLTIFFSPVPLWMQVNMTWAQQWIWSCHFIFHSCSATLCHSQTLPMNDSAPLTFHNRRRHKWHPQPFFSGQDHLDSRIIINDRWANNSV